MSKRARKKGDRRPNIPQVTLERYGGDQSAVPSRSLRPAGEFAPDYSHVISDLKRIGTLAAFFIVLLVVLSFILA